MTAPLKKEHKLLNDFVERFINGDLFSDDEVSAYLFQMNGVKKTSDTSNLTWAFYYACSKKEIEAIQSFRNALHYASQERSVFLTTMLNYLLTAGLVKEYVKTIKEESNFLKDHPSNATLAHTMNFYLLSGNVDGLVCYMKNIKWDESMNEALEVAKTKLAYAEGFHNETGMTNEQIEKAVAIMISIADKNKLSDFNIILRSFKEHDINSLVVLTSTKSAETIAKSNVELSYALVDDPELFDLDFSAVFEYSEAPTSYLEPILCQ